MYIFIMYFGLTKILMSLDIKHGSGQVQRWLGCQKQKILLKENLALLVIPTCTSKINCKFTKIFLSYLHKILE